jgi:hypothetical protein
MTTLTQPDMRPIKWRGSPRFYRVAEEWGFYVRGIYVRVPVNTIVDLASVPRPLWLLYPPDGLYRAAALAHDVLYSLKGKLPDGTQITRKEADQLLADLMRAAGVRESQAFAFHAAVRTFGWIPWLNSPGQLEFYRAERS